MGISREEVERIAELARLELDGARLESMRAELSAVLEFVAALRRLDLDGCEPGTFAPAGASLREDVPDGRRLDAATALAAAPVGEGGYFLVPPIVDDVQP
jgi:aspartyl-tRNA(Asn)/glutamyl-tRNA(Gln) amidotransferase subunit C